MKILFLINQFADGGRERRMVELVKGLDVFPDIDMHTIVFHNNIDYPDVLATKMTYECISCASRTERCKRIEKSIETYRPDIVHSWVDTPTELVLLASLKKKYHYVYIAGFVADGNRDKFFSFRHLSMMYTFWKSDAIVSNSIAGLKAKGAPQRKSYVIYNGFDFNRFSTIVNKENKRGELDIKTKCVAVMCARVNDAKDWDSFVHLASMAKTAKMDITFLAIGYGEKLKHYQDVTREEPNIYFIGRRTDVEEILQVSDFGILFTNSKVHAEGVSNSILESMAKGLPVIATNGGGTPEIIEDGMNGFLIKESDYKSAFTKLQNCIVDKELYTMVSENAIATVKTKFAISKMVKEYVELYKKLLN